MEDNQFYRNELFWGRENQKKLSGFNVAVFGLGGVGGFCAEMLARAGIGKLTIVDFDTVSVTNLNRQIIALNSTVGQKKTELFKTRLKDINNSIELNVIDNFYTDEPFSEKPDFVADAIDTMRSKVSLLEYCVKNEIPVISSMGAGNRVNPEKLMVCDMTDEPVQKSKDVFSKNVLYQLKKKGIEDGITFVVSSEKPSVKEKITEKEVIESKNIEFNKIIPASTPFVASCAGIFMASYIVRKLCDL